MSIIWDRTERSEPAQPRPFPATQPANLDGMLRFDTESLTMGTFIVESFRGMDWLRVQLDGYATRHGRQIFARTLAAIKRIPGRYWALTDPCDRFGGGRWLIPVNAASVEAIVRVAADYGFAMEPKAVVMLERCWTRHEEAVIEHTGQSLEQRRARLQLDPERDFC